MAYKFFFEVAELIEEKHFFTLCIIFRIEFVALLNCCLFRIVGYFKYCLSAQCVCSLAAIMSDFIVLCHGSFRFIGTLQEFNGAYFSSMSLSLSSSVSKVGHNVVEINWHIFALRVV